MALVLDVTMSQPPILKAIDEMLVKLADAVRISRESEKAVREYSDAIRALAQVCEDEETKANYLLALEDVTGKPGFTAAVKSVLRPGVAMTPKHVRDLIVFLKKMDLSGYANPMASIHTTLRRMEAKGEIEETTTNKGEKAYRVSEIAALKAAAFGPPQKD
jgi:hypothetical protein